MEVLKLINRTDLDVEKAVKISKTKKYISRVVIVLFLVLVVLLCFFPLFIMILTALKNQKETLAATFRFLPETPLFSNFVDCFARDNWFRYFFNSGFITLMVVLFSTFISSLAGFSFARLKFKGNTVLFMMFMAGIMIPSQVYIVPQYIMLRSIPLLGGNDITGAGGIGLLNSYWALIIPFTAAPLGIFLCRQFYLTFPRSLDDAARIDGCSDLKIFTSIYLPQSKTVFATFIILKFTYTWNEFFYPLIMTNSKEMYTVQIGLQQFNELGTVNWPLLMAATLVTMIPILIVFFAAQKYFVQGIVTSGLK